MNPMLAKLMSLKKGKKDLPEAEVEGKMSAMKQVAGSAAEDMGKKLGNLKKVTVASDSPQGIEKGLEVAKQVVSNDPEQDEMGELESDEDEVQEDPSQPTEEEQEMSAEELDAKILALIALKKEKQSAGI